MPTPRSPQASRERETSSADPSTLEIPRAPHVSIRLRWDASAPSRRTGNWLPGTRRGSVKTDAEEMFAVRQGVLCRIEDVSLEERARTVEQRMSRASVQMISRELPSLLAEPRCVRLQIGALMTPHATRYTAATTTSAATRRERASATPSAVRINDRSLAEER
jgi:hypothetical protein